MNGIFIAVLLMSATGTLLLLCLLLLRPLTRRIFNATWHYRICILIVLFLLIPVGNVGGSLADGVQNLTRHEIPQAPAVLDNMPAAEPYIQAPLRQEPLQADIEPNEPVSHADSTNIKALLPYFPHIWLAGALSFLLWHVIQFIRFKRKIVSASLPPVQPEKLSVLGRCASDMKLKKAPCLYTNSMVETPMLTDLFKTRLLLPEIQMDDRELYVIFRHELIHFKRYDLLVKFLAIMANAVHWFNPAAYWLTRNINTFCELSCDEQVVAGMTAEERHFYGETILNVLCRVASQRSGLCATLAESKNGIEKRLSHMMNVKKSSPGVVAVSVAAAMVLCLSGFAAAAVLNATSSENNRMAKINEVMPSESLTADEALEQLVGSIRYYDGGEVSFQIPENYSDSKDWNILVSGRLQYEDGFSRSMHLMDDINSIHGWEPGVRYGFRINDAYTELNMTASLPGENGEPVVKSIELPIMAQFQSDKQEILTLVNSFGQALKSVTLTAPDDIAAKNIEEHYSKYVTPELLSLWQADPQKAPGRKLSSPWPDRIDITGIGPVGDEEYTVSGEIIEVTSTELQNGTAAAKYPVTMRITKRDNRWLISGATINRNNNLTLEDFKKAKKIDEIIGEPGWEDTDLFILAELPGEDITMYGMKDADGRYENVAIRAGENINYFKWSYYPGSHDAGMSYKDYDNDGVKELAVHLYLGGGTGISTDQLFMLEEVSPGVFEPIQFESDDYVSQVENMVSCQVDEEEQTISLLKGGTELQRGDISWLEGEKVKSVRYGDIVEFDLSDGILMRITPGILVGDWVSPQYEGLSDLEATVEYHSDGTFHITDIR